jgi:hypothetical protein
MRDATLAGPGGARRLAVQPDSVTGYEQAFSVDDLPALRRLAAEYGRRAGLEASRVLDFVLAVNEAVTNAICHGDNRARLRLLQSGDDVCCEVRGGRWISTEPPSAVPDDTDGLRLWVVWQVCHEVVESRSSRTRSALDISISAGREITAARPTHTSG